MTELAIPVRADLISEIILRSRGRADVVSMVEHSVETFLERTRGDAAIWSLEHAEEVELEELDDTFARIGHPGRGYHWSGVSLPNGTSLRVYYKGKHFDAEVRHQQIFYEGEPCSPSQFASRAANNTSRNAWRDVWVKKPGSSSWEFADTLRRANRAR